MRSLTTMHFATAFIESKSEKDNLSVSIGGHDIIDLKEADDTALGHYEKGSFQSR